MRLIKEVTGQFEPLCLSRCLVNIDDGCVFEANMQMLMPLFVSFPRMTLWGGCRRRVRLQMRTDASRKMPGSWFRGSFLKAFRMVEKPCLSRLCTITAHLRKDTYSFCTPLYSYSWSLKLTEVKEMIVLVFSVLQSCGWHEQQAMLKCQQHPPTSKARISHGCRLAQPCRKSHEEVVSLRFHCTVESLAASYRGI